MKSLRLSRLIGQSPNRIRNRLSYPPLVTPLTGEDELLHFIDAFLESFSSRPGEGRKNLHKFRRFFFHYPKWMR